MSEPADHYAALDVAPDAPLDEIRAAWRLRLVAFHPDRFRDDDQRRRAEELSQRANAAWQVLGDPVQRARYDRARADRRRAGAGGAGGSGSPGSPGSPSGASGGAGAGNAPPPRPGPPSRRVPCPSCAARCTAEDAGGVVVALTCPDCGQGFSAMLGAHCIDRPRLQRRWMGLRYEMVVAASDGALDVVTFRRLPPELALAGGALLSIVFHPTKGRPVYAIAHDEGLDLGWRVA